MPKTKYSIVYKLTDKKSQTRNQTQWGENITHTTSGNGLLCSSGFLHAYHHPLLAVLLHPVHGSFDVATMQLWKCRGKVVIRQADKLGCTELTTIKKIALPIVSTNQCIAFAIYASLEVYSEPTYQTWAKNWLSGKERSPKAACTAYNAAYAAYATYAAYDTAYHAAYAAYTAYTYIAAYAAYASTKAEAAYTAYAAYDSTKAELTDKKLLALAKKALKIKENI